MKSDGVIEGLIDSLDIVDFSRRRPVRPEDPKSWPNPQIDPGICSNVGREDALCVGFVRGDAG
jgi:hypothetical protein